MGDGEEKADGFGDRLVGKAKEVAGSVLGNEELREEGQLHQQRARADAAAAKAEAAAGQREAMADVVVEERELAAERLRLKAGAAQMLEESRIEQDRQAEQSGLDDEARQLHTMSRHQELAEKQAAERMEATAMRERQVGEAEATRLESEASEARRLASRLDAATNPTSTEENK
jgi:uncharacterized protein YjbJ (UPF0337 family)